MSDYPRDLKDKDGNVKEFKSKDDVPPGWFVRDTGEEVNPLKVDVPEDLKPKKKGKAAPVVEEPEEPASE